MVRGPEYGDAGDDVLNNRKSRRGGTLVGGFGDDVLRNGAGNFGDSLYGGYGDDRLYAVEGWDTLYGGYGHDLLFGGKGRDRLNGGFGDDVHRGGRGSRDGAFIHRWGQRLAWLPDPGGRSRQPSTRRSIGFGLDVISGIEDVEGSRFADVIKGNGLPNRIVGREGNDDLFGAGGDDVLDGDAYFVDFGNNHINGGQGTDECLNPTPSEGAINCEGP